MTISADFYTQKNNKDPQKPNEDHVFVDKNINLFIILDGVSRDETPYPAQSPSAAVSALCARTMAGFIAENLDYTSKEQLLFDAMVKGNEAVAAFNADYTGDFPPGTCGIAALIAENRLFFAQIGDCEGRIVEENASFTFTFDFIQPLRAYQKNKKYFLHDKHSVRKNLCNNPQSLLGYGVLDGNKNAKHFIKTHQIPLGGDCRIVLHTDGLSGWIKAENPDLSGLSAAQMVEASRAYNDKLGKTSDDTSAIVIDILGDKTP